jgi:predicted transposase/invertase (TIGR01784 family)
MSQIFYDVCNDIAFKKVFNNHANLTIKFLNATLRLEGDRAIREVQFLPQELLPNTSESKKSILDVRCTDQRGFQYIVEVQNKALQPYLQRVQYYVSHTYAGQLKTAQSYLELKPVTMLSILNHTLFPKEISFLSFHSNVELETQKSYLTDMSYAFIELPKFTKPWTELKAPEDYWVYLLKESRHMQEIPDEAPTEIKEALNLLEEHAWSGEEREAYLKAKMLVLDDQSALLTAKEEGKLEGLLQAARVMKELKTMTNAEIATRLGLKEDEVAALPVDRPAT